MRLRPAIALLAYFFSFPATAQERLALTGSEACVQPACVAPREVVSRVRLTPESKPAPFAAAAKADDFLALSAMEEDPLARFHFFHNERIHALRQRAWRNLFANPVYLFRFWYTSRKGMTLLHFRDGRLRVGVETQRLLVPGQTRGDANLFGDMGACHSVPTYQGGVCRPLLLHEGERRYAITLRWNLNRQVHPRSSSFR